MVSPPAQPRSLEETRREIDRIDDAILALVGDRLAMVDHVRALKSTESGPPTTPLRPGREAQILRRIIARSQGTVPADLCFRLWRALISAATQRQAPVRVHGPAGLFTSAGDHLLVKEHFGSAELVSHPGEASALATLAERPGDVAALRVDSPWVAPFLAGMAGPAQVIGCLPFLANAAIPRILLLGHAPPEPTGADETLVITGTPLPRDHAPDPRWRLDAGNRTLASFPGFLSAGDSPLCGLAPTLIGRYPSPIEVRS